MAAGYFAAFAYLFCLASGIFLFGYAARRAAAVTITFLEVVLGFLFITLLLLFRQNLPVEVLLTKPTSENWLHLGLAALFGFVSGNYFSVKNLKWGGETLNGLLSPAITAAVVLFSVFVDKANISLTQTTGVLLTLSAVISFLLFSKGKRIAVVDHSKALWSGLATILCMTATIVFSLQGASSGSISIFHALWLRLLLALPFVLGLLLFQKNRSFSLGSRFYLVVIGGVLLQTVAGSYFWFVASFQIGIPVFQSLIATLPLWTYAADVFVFRKSTFSLVFLLAAVVAVAGVVLLM